MIETFDQAYKEKLLATFQFVIDFFTRYNLQWCVAGGTAIGAVRHKGMIPWDDDIDINMPREDAYRLMTLEEELERSGYSLLYYGKGEYPNLFMKIVDNSTTIWENKSFPIVYGVYVDIFITDHTNVTKEEYSEKYLKQCKYFRRCVRVSAKYHFSQFLHDIKGLHLRSIQYGFENMFYYNHLNYEQNYRKFQEFETSFLQKEGKAVVVQSGLPVIEYFPEEWFSATETVPFETFKVKIMSGWDEYLTARYGDYMKLPPVHMWRTHHGQYYINLKEKLDINEVIERKKNGENYVF